MSFPTRPSLCSRRPSHLIHFLKMFGFQDPNMISIKVHEISNGWTHWFRTPKKPDYRIALKQPYWSVGKKYSMIDGEDHTSHAPKYTLLETNIAYKIPIFPGEIPSKWWILDGCDRFHLLPSRSCTTFSPVIRLFF